MRRVMFTGAQDWSNWFAVRQTLAEELEKGPFVAVHNGRPDVYLLSGVDAGSGRCVEFRVGCVDAYIAEEAPKMGLQAEVAKWADVQVESLHAFPGYGDEATVSAMAWALARGIPVTNHGYQSATSKARGIARRRDEGFD